MRIILTYITFLAVFLSCKERIWDNPFDPDCPREIFTPVNFTATQSVSGIKLNWKGSHSKISGYAIYKNTNDGAWMPLSSPGKNDNFYFDGNISGGIKYGYQLVATAGFNQSNEVTAYCTPVFNPTINTNPVSFLTSNSTYAGGNITFDGGATVSVRGICYGTNPNPSISGNKTVDGSGLGSFSSIISDLQANTTYYIRAYATNKAGTGYGNQISFKTLEPNLVTDRDGNIYRTVIIGTQVWMVENLKTTMYNNGESIPFGSGYCYYNNEISYKDIYGAIYNFYTAMDSRGICPPGWHVPMINEWTELCNHLGGVEIAGGKMKKSGTLHWQTPNTGATNSSGFSALPGGSRDCSGNYVGLRTGISWYISEKPSGGWISGISCDANSTKLSFNINAGFDCNASYVRCMKN